MVVKNKRVVIKYINPVSNTTDKLYVKEDFLDNLKIKNGSGIRIFSFFHVEKGDTYLIDIHLDNNNKVRSVNQKIVKK